VLALSRHRNDELRPARPLASEAAAPVPILRERTGRCVHRYLTAGIDGLRRLRRGLLLQPMPKDFMSLGCREVVAKELWIGPLAAPMTTACSPIIQYRYLVDDPLVSFTEDGIADAKFFARHLFNLLRHGSFPRGV
jgi:hypothetical protein